MDTTERERYFTEIFTNYSKDMYRYVISRLSRHDIAEEIVSELNAQGIWDRPIVTEVTRLDTFFMAEDYHQEYFARNQNQPYCQAVVAPKVAKFRKHYLELLKKQVA